MKNRIFLLTTAAVLTLSSCGKKNTYTALSEPVESVSSSAETDAPSETAAAATAKSTDKSENTTKTDKASPEKTVTTAAAETEDTEEEIISEYIEFHEYRPEDFKEITVNLNRIKDDTAPINIVEKDIPGITWSPRRSDCKSEENRGRYKDDAALYIIDDTESYQEQVENLCNSDYEGTPIYADLDGEYLYYLVNYDDLCEMYTHCFSLIRCNTNTGESQEVFEYNSADDDFYVNDMICFNGEIYISVSKSVSEQKIFHINTTNKKLEALPPLESRCSYKFVRRSKDKLMIFCDNFDTISTYIPNSKKNEWELINDTDLITQKSKQYVYFGEIMGIPIDMGGDYLTGCADDEGKCYAECKNFRLETGRENLLLAAYSENRVTFVDIHGFIGKIYTYDLEKMECYISELTGMGSDHCFFGMGGDLFMVKYVPTLTTQKTLYYIVPDIGLQFEVEKLDIFDRIYSNGDSVWALPSEDVPSIPYYIQADKLRIYK